MVKNFLLLSILSFNFFSFGASAVDDDITSVSVCFSLPSGFRRVSFVYGDAVKNVDIPIYIASKFTLLSNLFDESDSDDSDVGETVQVMPPIYIGNIMDHIIAFFKYGSDYLSVLSLADLRDILIVINYLGLESDYRDEFLPIFTEFNEGITLKFIFDGIKSGKNLLLSDNFLGLKPLNLDTKLLSPTFYSFNEDISRVAISTSNYFNDQSSVYIYDVSTGAFMACFDGKGAIWDGADVVIYKKDGCYFSYTFNNQNVISLVETRLVDFDSKNYFEIYRLDHNTSLGQNSFDVLGNIEYTPQGDLQIKETIIGFESLSFYQKALIRHILSPNLSLLKKNSPIELSGTLLDAFNTLPFAIQNQLKGNGFVVCAKRKLRKNLCSKLANCFCKVFKSRSKVKHDDSQNDESDSNSESGSGFGFGSGV